MPQTIIILHLPYCSQDILSGECHIYNRYHSTQLPHTISPHTSLGKLSLLTPTSEASLLILGHYIPCNIRQWGQDNRFRTRDYSQNQMLLVRLYELEGWLAIALINRVNVVGNFDTFTCSLCTFSSCNGLLQGREGWLTWLQPYISFLSFDFSTCLS